MWFSIMLVIYFFSFCASHALASNFVWAALIGDEHMIYEGTSEPNKLRSVCKANFAFYIRKHLNSGRALSRSWDCNLVFVQACPIIGDKPLRRRQWNNILIKCSIKHRFSSVLTYPMQIMSSSVTFGGKKHCNLIGISIVI